MDDTLHSRDDGPIGTALTLEETAALLVQLEIGDGRELSRLQTALEDLALEGGLAPAAQAKTAGAARRVREALAAGGETGTALLAAAGRLLEEATIECAPAARAPEPASEDRDHEALDPSLLTDFVIESREAMGAAEASLLELELDPDDREAIDTVFRAFHTIKGTSAFLGLDAITGLAHHAESLFERFREGELPCTGPRADLALRTVDMLSAVLTAVEKSTQGGAFRHPEGYAELMRILEDPEAVGVLDDADEEAPPRLGDILVLEGKVDREKLEAVVAKGEGPLGLALVREHAASLTDVAQALRKQRRAAPVSGPDTSVRLRTDQLDQLLDTVGELVIAQSLVAQDPGIAGDLESELARKVGHAGKLVRDLQELSLSLRMAPLKPTFQRMTRLVRDVAKKTGKLVDFVTEGEDTEMDRSLVELIGDPLVHMIRNAVDHGIESPEARVGAGKPRAGTVRLAAYYAGGSVVVELTDDGKGLDRDAILRKAIARGLIETEVGMSDAEIFDLIFAPGFSTAETITDLSGRGVGMDVVKRNIESLRGRLDVSSAAGRGSSFAIRLPVTLAVTEGMLVQVAGEPYLIPTVNVERSFRPDREMVSTSEATGETVRLRHEILPIVRLHRLFDLEGARTDPSRALLVIVGSGDARCALLVDELLGQHRVLAKPIGGTGGALPAVSGRAILGDGRVGLILDAAAITGRAGNPLPLVPLAV